MLLIYVKINERLLQHMMLQGIAIAADFSKYPLATSLARIRLKAGFNISGYSATNQIILKAMKKYGLILADISGNLYISGAPDARWKNDDLRKLGQSHGSDFEVVKFNN
jgi:hypothetical protein